MKVSVEFVTSCLVIQFLILLPCLKWGKRLTAINLTNNGNLARQCDNETPCWRKENQTSVAYAVVVVDFDGRFGNFKDHMSELKQKSIEHQGKVMFIVTFEQKITGNNYEGMIYSPNANA